MQPLVKSWLYTFQRSFHTLYFKSCCTWLFNWKIVYISKPFLFYDHKCHRQVEVGSPNTVAKDRFPCRMHVFKIQKKISSSQDTNPQFCAVCQSTNIIITEKISRIINVYVLFFKYSLIKYRSCTAEICNDLLFHSTWSMLGNTFLKNDCRGRNVRNW